MCRWLAAVPIHACARVDARQRLLGDAARGPGIAARQRGGCRGGVQLLGLRLLLLQVLLLLQGGGGQAGAERRAGACAGGRGALCSGSHAQWRLLVRCQGAGAAGGGAWAAQAGRR